MKKMRDGPAKVRYSGDVCWRSCARYVRHQFRNYKDLEADMEDGEK